MLGSRVDRPLVAPAVTAKTSVDAARRYVRRFGGALGLGVEDGLTLTENRSLRAAGSVVTFRQSVQGMPVVGGELVVGLDHADNLVSLGGEATEEPRGGAATTVPGPTAAGVALAASARGHDRPAGAMKANEPRLWFYDPQVLGVEDPAGARPVWQVEVSDGLAVRDLVLVDAVTGRVALRVEQVNAADRVVCDRQNVLFVGIEADCVSAQYTRTEAGPESTVPDVEAAFTHAGAAATLFADVAGRDLVDFAGVDAGDGPKVRSTVRVCVQGDACPMPNAFWNGRGMYYGEGYAAADDVVGHELTHAVIDRTAGLFYHYQAGAINESMSDVFGELVDVRYGDDDGDQPWAIGEDAPGGTFRDMADPGAFGQPDRMTSSSYVADPSGEDAGGVHTNSGVGNKAAYLIAEGGHFNGQDVTGLDTDQPARPKTAAIYWAALQLLTSASDYEDLYLVLPQACRQLASANVAGLVAGDCEQVGKAVTATEMNLQPATPDTAAPEAPRCPAGQRETSVFADDFEQHSGAWAPTGVWQSTPSPEMPSYATSGTRSFFGWDPDPYLYGDPADSKLTLEQEIEVPTSGPAFLWFNHAYLFEWYDDGLGGRRYVDGGRVEYSVDGGFTWTNAAGLPWVHGPDRPLTLGTSTTVTGFGGDSHGYTSSRLNLSSLAGQSVQFRWRITGNQFASTGLGWWLDDVSVHTCHPVAPSAPTQVRTDAGMGSVDVHWQAPTWSGTGIGGYRVTTSDPARPPVELSAGTLDTRLVGLRPGETYRIQIRALDASGQPGAAARTVVTGSRMTIAAPSRTVYATKALVSGQLTRVDTHDWLWGQAVRVYRRPSTGGRWTLEAGQRTRNDGSYSIRVTPPSNSVYRTEFGGDGSALGSRSREVVVEVRPRLGAQLSSRSVRKGGEVSVHGRAEPLMTGQRLLLQRRGGGGWQTIKTLRLKGASYRFSLPTSRRGTFRYRVSTLDTARWLAGRSLSKRLRVY